jgi:hypothetical protein
VVKILDTNDICTAEGIQGTLPFCYPHCAVLHDHLFCNCMAAISEQPVVCPASMKPGQNGRVEVVIFSKPTGHMVHTHVIVRTLPSR